MLDRIGYEVSRRWIFGDDRPPVRVVQVYVWSIGDADGTDLEWGEIYLDEPGAWQRAHCRGYDKCLEACVMETA